MLLKTCSTTKALRIYQKTWMLTTQSTNPHNVDVCPVAVVEIRGKIRGWQCAPVRKDFRIVPFSECSRLAAFSKLMQSCDVDRKLSNNN